MNTSSMYSKVGICTPETRISKVTAAIILIAFGALLCVGYAKLLPRIEAHNTAANSAPPR